MLNTAAILGQPIRAGLPSTGDPSASEPATPPFAQALDAASARQHGTHEDAGAEAGTPSAPQGPAELPANATAPSSVAARAAAARKAAAQVTQAGAGLPTDTAAQRPQEAVSLARAGQVDAGVPQADEPLPFDLAAWVPGLPLPPNALRQAPVAEETTLPRTEGAGASAAADRTGRTDPGAMALLPCASDESAIARAVEAQTPRELLPKGEGGRTQPSAFDDLRAIAASSRGGDTDSRAAVQALVQGLAPVRQSLSIDAARDGAPGAGAPIASIAAAMTQATPAWTPSAPPFQAELAVPLGTPEFAPALGSQLSVLVRDGVEHARLKLNPAEMGPIDVRISVDGPQAQVEFSAAHAGTRQMLQDAVPALASALRESGLTLTGGGVFDQPREQRGDMQRGPSPQRGTAFDDTNEALPSSAQVSRPTTARGVVDLYA